MKSYLIVYQLSKLLYTNQMVMRSFQVFDVVNPAHTDQQKVKKIGTGRVPTYSVQMIKSVNRGILGAKLSFLFKVFHVLYLEDGLVPTFIGSSSGIFERISHVAFLPHSCMSLSPTFSPVIVAHVLGHVSSCSLCSFLRICRSIVENILFE